MNKKVFWLLLIALHLLFFCKQIFFGNSLIQDSKEYLYAADNLMNKGTLYSWNMNFAFSADWLSRRPFLYPFILMLFKFLSFGNQTGFFILIYAVQNLLSLFNIRLVLRLCEKRGFQVRLGPVLVFLLFSVSQLIYSNLIMSEIWLQSSLLGILSLMLSEKQSIKTDSGIAVLLIAAMSLKPVMMVLAFAFPALVILMNLKSLKLRHCIYLLPLIYYFSICQINERRTGYFHYSSISTFNLLHYNTYVMLMNEHGTKKADSIIDRIRAKAGFQGSYANSQIYIQDECKKLIKENLFKYSYLHVRGMVFAMFDPGRFDLTQFFRLPHGFNLIYKFNQGGLSATLKETFLNPLGLILILLILFNIYRNIHILLFVFRRSLPLKFRFLVLLIPAYVLIMTGPIGTSRFFMPLVPFALMIYILVKQKKKA